MKVTSSPNSVALNEPLSGAYELFMYTFATGSPVPSGYGDSLYAGTGDDTLVGGTADDVIAGVLPQDTVIYGSGTITQIPKAPDVDVSIGSSQTIAPGQSVTLTGTYVDPDYNDTHMYSWTATNSSGKEVAEGTNSYFTFTPAMPEPTRSHMSYPTTTSRAGTASVRITASASPLFSRHRRPSKP